MTIDLVFTAFVMGLLGSGHCIAMCGGVTSSLTIAIQDKRLIKRYTLLYNLGRLFSYTLAGLLAATIGQHVASRSTLFSHTLSALSGVFMILVGLYIMRFTVTLNWVERIGKFVIWQHIVGLNRKLLPVNTNNKALAYGMLWGWLPCGLVYSALLFSLSTKNALSGALFMMIFAAGTLPAMLGLALAAESLKRVLNHTVMRLMFGNLFIFYGTYILIMTFL